MKKTLLTAAAMAILCGGVAWAENDAKDAAKAPTTKPANKMCAVMTEHPVDDRVTIQHDGKTIGFCCEDCISTFKENPAKYTAAMK